MGMYQAFGIASLVSLAVGALGIYFLMVKRKTREMRFQEKARAQGCVAEGRFLSKSFNFGGGDTMGKRRSGLIRENKTYYSDFGSSWRVEYGYEVAGKSYTVHRDFPLDYPDVLEVYYDPRNPAKCVTSSDDTSGKKNQSGCLTSLLMMIVVFVVVDKMLMGL